MRPDARLAGHPALAFVTVAVIGFAALAATAVLVGWLLKTYALPEHGFGHADEHVNVWLAHHRTATRNDLSFWLSGMGDVYAIPALVAVTALVAAALRRWRAAAFIVTAIAIEAGTYRVVTSFIHRQRPRVPRLDDLPADASYYSGHTAASVAVYCGVAVLITSWMRSGWARAVCWTIAVVIPLLVGLSRMYRGMHHPLDIAGGVVIGIAAVSALVLVSRASGEAAR